MPEPAPAGFWSRATFALACAVYGWIMMGVELYLVGAHPAEAAARGLANFRRVIMGRAVVSVGGAAVLAALVLGLLALGRRRQRVAAIAGLVLAAGWIACLVGIWPI